MAQSRKCGDILKYMSDHQADILRDLEQFVKMESPSHNKRLVDECGAFLQRLMRNYFGVNPEVFPQTEAGHHLKYTFGGGEERLLILTHFDTVWDEGRLPFRIESNKAYGPGIFDMKGGIMQAIWALKAIKALGISLNKEIVFLLTSDEEIGSSSSQALIETEAKRSDAVLVPEPPVAKTGALKTARKGVGMFELVVRGRAAHAGNSHKDGVNALEELSRQIIALHALTDYEKGSTVNVGVAHGGTRSNVVPEHAQASIDLRVETPEEAERLTSIIQGLKPHMEEATVEVTGGMNRPPMVRTSRTAEMFQTARSIAERLGFNLEETSVGGASDGNFTAALGIPTLDGLGAEGEGPHAEHEHVYIDALPRRAAMFAHLLLEV